MADRYWVGGSGTWNTTSTTNWSASSGGPSGASVPTVSDSVFFDQNSTYTVTMTGALACLDFNVTDGTVTFQNGTTPTLNVRGSWSTVAETVWNTTGVITFSATTSRTITSNNITIRSPITFAGTGTYTLQDNLSLLTTLTTTLTTGTLSLGTNTLSTGLFASSGTGVRTINFGTGKIQLTSATTSTIWNTGTITSLTISGTSLVECITTGTGVTKTITTGALSAANSISFSLLNTVTGTTYALGTSVFRDLLVDGVQTISNSAITIFGNFTHTTDNGNTTFTAGTNAWTFAATSGTPSINFIEGFTYDFPWTIGTATASTAVYTLLYNLTLGATRQLSLVRGTFDFNNKTFSGGGLTFNGAPVIQNTNGTLISVTGTVTHTSGNITLPCNLTSTGSYTFTAGTLTLNQNILTATAFLSSGSTARTLAFGTASELRLTGNNITVFDVTTATNFTTTGTVYINCTYTGSVGTRVITTNFSQAQAQQATGYNVNFGGSSGIVLSTSATDTLTLLGNFNDIDFTNFNGTLNNSARSLFGNLVLSSLSGTLNSGTAITTLASTTNTQSITSNGATLDFSLQFTGAGTKTLVDKLTLGTTRATILGSLGRLDLNDQILETGIFQLSGTNARTLDFKTSSEIRLTGNNTTILNLTSSANLIMLGTVFFNSVYTGNAGTRIFNSDFTQAQAIDYGLDVFTSGSAGIVIGTTATDQFSLTGNYNNLDLTGFTNTWAPTGTLLYGNLIVPGSGGNITGSTSTLTFSGTGTNSTVTTNGRTLDFPITVNSLNGTVTLLDNLTLGTSRRVTHSQGTLDINDLVLSSGDYFVSGTGIKTIDFGDTGQYEIKGNNTTVLTITSFSNVYTILGNVYFNLSYTGGSGTRTINISGINETQAKTKNINFSTTGTSGIVWNPNATDALGLNGNYNDINLTGVQGNLVSTGSGATFTLYGNLVIPSGFTWTAITNTVIFASTDADQTITSNGSAIGFDITISLGNNYTLRLLDSLTPAGNRTITFNSGIFDINDFTVTIQRILSSVSNNRSIDFGTNGQIYLTGSVVTILDFSIMTNFSYAGTPRIYCTYSLNQGTRVINMGTTAGATLDNTFDLSIGNTGTGIVLYPSTDTLSLTGSYKEFDLTGLTATIGGATRTIFGNFTVPNSGPDFAATTSFTTFAGPDTHTITTNGRTIDIPMAIGNGSSYGNIILAGALTSGARGLSVNSGNFLLNDFTATFGTLNCSGNSIRSINFGNSGEIVLVSGNTTVVNISSMTNFFSSGNVMIRSTYSLSTGTRTFALGNVAAPYYNDTFNISFTGNNGIVLGNSSTDSKAVIGYYKDVDFTNIAGTITNVARTIYGNFVVPAAGGTLTAGANETIIASPITEPVANGYSVYFDGNGDNLSLANNTALDLTSGDFTIEGWFYCLTLTGNMQQIINKDGQSGTSYPQYACGITSNGKFRCEVGSGNGISYLQQFTTANSVTLNMWNHFAFVKSGSTITVYLNGVSDVSGTQTGSMVAGPRALLIGYQTGQPAGQYFNGYLSNLRIVKGTALYTANFIPPTAPLTAIANTSLLTCQNNLFVDNSTNNFPITVVGNPVPSPVSAFSVMTPAIRTITTNNRTLDFPISVGDPAVGPGIYQMADALTLGATRNFGLNSGIVDLNDLTLTARTFSSTNLFPRSIDFGSTGQLTLIGNSVVVMNMAQASEFSYQGTPKIFSSYNAGTGTRTFALGNSIGFSNSNSMFDFNINGSNGLIIAGGTDSIAIVGETRDLDLRSTTNTITNTVKLIYGNFYTSASGGTFTAGTAITTFASTSGISTIDTEARALAFPITFNGVGGNWTLANNLVANATTVLTLANGIVDFNQKALTYANITVATGNSGLSNLSTTLNFVHSGANANLTIYSGAINVSTTGTYVVSGTGSSVILEGPLSTGAFTLTAGNLILANANLTCPTFTSNGSGVRSVQFSSQNIIVTSTGTVVNMPTATNFTSTGTGNVVVTHDGNTAITITPGGPLEGNALNFNFIAGNYNLTITAGNVNSLDFTGYSGNLLNTATRLFGNLTLSNTMSLASGTAVMTFANNSEQYILTNGRTLDFPVTVAKTGNRLVLADTTNIGNTRTITLTSGNLDVANPLNCGPFIHSNGALLVNAPANTLAYTLNGGNLILNNNDLSVTELTSNNSTARSIEFNGNINVRSTSFTVVNMATATNLIPTGNGNINITSTGSSAITVAPGNNFAGNTINYNILGGNYSFTLSAGSVKNLNFTGFGGTLLSSTTTLHGNLILSANMAVGATPTSLNFAAISDSQYITTNGITVDKPIVINNLGGNVILNDALTVGSARTLTLSNGTLNLNNVTLTANNFVTAAGNKSIIFDGGTLLLTGSGNVFNNSNPTDFTTQTGNSVGVIRLTNASAKTFIGGNATYNAKLDQAGAGNLTITGNNSFNDLMFSYTDANSFILFTADTTTSFESFTAQGTSNTNYLGLYSSNTNASANVAYTGNISNVTTDYCSVRNINFSPFITDGSQPSFSWYLGSNSVNGGSVSGALFIDNNTETPIIYVLETGNSWTVPNNWSNANNQIYLYGAGGGGGAAQTSRGGGGGGGGGFTEITNFSATKNSNISYEIGLGGEGGTAPSGSGSNGGNTIWSSNIFIAGGGGGGSNANVQSAGGIGLTYNGGNGGFGGSTQFGTQPAGGGGAGGAGGPFGNGGNGGSGPENRNGDAGLSGGGGSGGGNAGANGSTSIDIGASGGNNYLGFGGGTANNIGILGGGGGSNNRGGQGIDIYNSIGGGGGQGGIGTTTTSNKGPDNRAPSLYGGGGGGGSYIYSLGTNTGSIWNGSGGANGAIIILYYPSDDPVFDSTNKMFLVF
jgi:hypothetical protein